MFLIDKDDNTGEGASESSLDSLGTCVGDYVSLYKECIFIFFNWCSLRKCSFKITLPYLVTVTPYTREFDGIIFPFLCPI